MRYQMKTVTKPVRDIDPAELRTLMGFTVTAKAYEDSEATEPASVITGTLESVVVAEHLVALGFEGLTQTVVPSSQPVTLTWESTDFTKVDTTGKN